jgi:hypothetical protein
MKNLNGSGIHNIIEQGLTIFFAEGTAPAWVFMTSNSLPPSIVAEVLATAIKQRATLNMKSRIGETVSGSTEENTQST